MKKNFLVKLFALVMVMILAVNFAGIKVFAINDYGQYIFDDAGMLTQDEFDSLNDYARQISEYYECGVHILTTSDETKAEEYVEVNEIDMRIRKDKFKFMNRSESRISTDKDSNRGGTTVNSRGFSGKGGKY